jgi:hypothetical protein
MKKTTILEPTFHIPIILLWDCDADQLDQFTEKRFGVSCDGEHTGDGYFTRFSNREAGDVGVIALTFPVWEASPYQQAILSHEILHACFRFLKERGVKYAKASEEAFCYVLSSLMEQAAEKMASVEERFNRKK